MKKQELITAVKAFASEIAQDMPDWADTVGVRYDNIETKVGMELECSISNFDRDDQRDFPVYDANADRMEGTSCYLAAYAWDSENDTDTRYHLDSILSGKREANWLHCSLVIGKKTDDYCEDEGEVILEGAEVVKVFW
jgi:hypothetical protein